MKALVLIAVLAAVVMAADWDAEVRLTDNSWPDYNNWSGQRRVAVDQAGRVHTVWYVMNSNLGTYKFQVYYKRFVPGSGWTADTMLSADLYAANTYCKYPAIVVNPAGRVFAVWGGGSSDAADEKVYLKTCLPEGSGNDGWDEVSIEVSASGPSQAKTCPNLAATPDGRVHAVWLETATIVYREHIDTTWQTEVRLVTPGGYKAYPVIAGGPDNNVHVGWYGRLGASGFYDVWYTCRADTTWGPTEEVSQGERHQMYPSLTVNPVTGDPHMIWQCYAASDNTRRLVHGWRTSGGWQPRDTLSESGSEHAQGTGQIAFTPDGKGHAVWAGKSDLSPTVNQVRYCERAVSGTWTEPVNVTDTSNARDRPSIIAGAPAAPNDLYMVWADYRMGNSEVYYAHATPSVQFIEEWNEGEITPGRLKVPGIVRAVLRVECGGARDKGGVCLLDITGRHVMALAPGENDVRRLSPGVYFVRQERPGCGYRVVVLR